MPCQRLLSVFALCLGISAAAATAQDPPANPPQAVAAERIDIPLEHIQLQLVPRTLAELEAAASAWRDRVRAQAMDVADAAIASRTAAEGSEEKRVALAKFDEVTQAQKALLDRFGVVLDAWEAKGGNTDEFRSYAEVVGGAKIGLADSGSPASAFGRWLRSPDGGIKWGIKLVVFLVILIVFRIISGVVAKLVDKVMARHRGTSELLDRFVNKITRRSIMLIGFLVAVSTLGVNVGALLALMGGGAFILGFALQDTLGNFANGLMLLIYQPFDVGDSVEVGGISGSVDSVSLVNTKIKTFDNKIILVPNKDVWGQTITNATRSDVRRVDLVFGIGYDDAVDKAQAILEKIVAEHELVLSEPEPNIKMHELADSAVNFICRPWAKTADYWTVYWDITKQVKAEFDASGISIPYPQQDVHIHQAAG